MRPSPLVLLALVALGFAVIAVPLARLTGAEGAVRRSPAGPEAADGVSGTGAAGGVETLVRIRFAHPPLAVKISQDARTLAVFGAPSDPTTGQMEARSTLALAADEAADLLVEAAWPEGTPATALGVEVEPDGHETRRATVWTDGPALVELLNFSWK